MRYTTKPESFEAITVTASTTAADFQALYAASAPNGTATIGAFKSGTSWFVTTSDDENWSGRFTTGDLVRYVAPVFLKLEPADRYAPYGDIYGGGV